MRINHRTAGRASRTQGASGSRLSQIPRAQALRTIGGYTDTLIAPTGGGAVGHVPRRKRVQAPSSGVRLPVRQQRGPARRQLAGHRLRSTRSSASSRMQGSHGSTPPTDPETRKFRERVRSRRAGRTRLARDAGTLASARRERADRRRRCLRLSASTIGRLALWIDPRLAAAFRFRVKGALRHESAAIRECDSAGRRSVAPATERRRPSRGDEPPGPARALPSFQSGSRIGALRTSASWPQPLAD
jgi:hypothetical protein